MRRTRWACCLATTTPGGNANAEAELWIVAALAALAIAAIAAPVAQARQFEGEIVAHNAKAKTFKIREDEGGGTFKVKVTKQTFYQGISGFKAIRSAAPTSRSWPTRPTARGSPRKVETRGGSGGGGKDD